VSNRNRARARLLLFLLVFLPLVAAPTGWVAWPLPSDVANPGPVPSLVIEDRHGLVLRATRSADGLRGGWIPLGEVDPEIIQAFLAAEDHRFFQHHGVDLRAAVRALRDNVDARRVVSGASTITMQTARILRSPDRSWLGKAWQTLWALRLEAHMDKQRILEQYLNRVPLGQGAVGVAAASSLYFGASASSVSLGQAALLAALARAPARDNPLVNPERARQRRDHVLARMASLGYAQEQDIGRAAIEPVFTPVEVGHFLAPHFTTRVLQWAGDARATGRWRTTLDLELQRVVEAEVRHTVAVLRDRGARHAAAVVLDNASGGVLAWVGSPDFFADSAGQVDMVVSPRQPGSALKPFLYALAFERGFTPASVIADVPRAFATTSTPYRPQNYDRRFRGPVRAREALASSYNVPAVDIADRLGTAALLTTLRDAGFASLTRSADHYGLGLALGNGEVTLLELANAYRGLANGGVWRPTQWRANAVQAHDGRRFASAGATALVLDILSDPVARIPGFGVETTLEFPFPVAAKTGTSRHFTDNWAVASTAGFTVAVWVGNFSGQPMRGVSGITGAGPLLHRAVLEIARRYAPGHLPTPDMLGAIATPICILSGMRATPECPSMVEWFLPGTEPTAADDWQRGGVTVLPPEYAEWVAAGDRRKVVTGGELSSGSEGAGQDVAYRIISPQDGDRYERPAGVEAKYATLPLTAVGAAGEAVRWYVDGRPLDSARWPLEQGVHLLRAVWASGRADSVRIVVN
jgi:penicillin-binding protein 1C